MNQSVYNDDSDYITVQYYNLTVRSLEGLRVQVDYYLHYKVGVSFNNFTALANEFYQIYVTMGEQSSWSDFIFRVTVASIKDVC